MTYDPNDPDPAYRAIAARPWYRHPATLTLAAVLFVLLIAFCAIRVLG